MFGKIKCQHCKQKIKKTDAVVVNVMTAEGSRQMYFCIPCGGILQHATGITQ